MLQKANHTVSVLYLTKYGVVCKPWFKLAHIDQFSVNESPLFSSVSNCNSVRFESRQSGCSDEFSLAIDNAKAKLFKLTIVIIVYVVHLLQTNERSFTLIDFLNYSRPSKCKVQYLRAVERVELSSGKLVCQDVVAHHLYRAVDEGLSSRRFWCDCTLTSIRIRWAEETLNWWVIARIELAGA